ncbi:MAG TPA: hypothetical protein VN667_10095, partial [Burkholderiales bacterium]|nr:hypothetical protein [Burkholderiales bacterium]
SRLVVSHRWSDWKSEVTWMSLYFSVAVWLSIALVHAPVLRPDVAVVKDKVEKKRLPSPRLLAR